MRDLGGQHRHLAAGLPYLPPLDIRAAVAFPAEIPRRLQPPCRFWSFESSACLAILRCPGPTCRLALFLVVPVARQEREMRRRI